MTIEFRQWESETAELRAEGDGMSFQGYAIRYGVPSSPLPFTEFIAEGAATRTLASRNNIKAFVNHDTNLVIGSTRAGTLRLSEDARGVLAEISLPETSYGRDLAESVRRGDVSGMSFGFSTVADEWSNDHAQRTVTELRLHEVSPVTGFEAYTQTTAAVRSALIHLARRTALDVDTLADAMTALESGQELNSDQVDVLSEALDRSRPKADAEPEPEPTIPIDVLLAKLNLLEKDV